MIQSSFHNTPLSTLFFLFTFFLSGPCSTPDDSTLPTLYSEHVEDSFELHIDLPEGYDPGQQYSVVFYTDANLKIGKELRAQIRSGKSAGRLRQVIFVGIGHIGNYRQLRRRDFIPPVFENGQFLESEDELFGHADDFYQFLKLELIPYVEEQYSSSGLYSFIGHSFGGLFAFYALTQPEPLFVNHIALSPSLWVNYNNYFSIEEQFHKTGKSPKGYLYHACGNSEWANKVLSTSRQMSDTLKKRAYPQLDYEYEEHQGKGHNGMVPVALEYVLENTEF